MVSWITGAAFLIISIGSVLIGRDIGYNEGYQDGYKKGRKDEYMIKEESDT